MPMDENAVALFSSLITFGGSIIVFALGALVHYFSNKHSKRSIPILSILDNRTDDILQRIKGIDIRIYNYEESSKDIFCVPYLCFWLTNWDQFKINDVKIQFEFLQTNKIFSYSAGFIYPKREILIPVAIDHQCQNIQCKIRYITEYGEVVTYVCNVLTDLTKREDSVCIKLFRKRKLTKINKDLSCSISCQEFIRRILEYSGSESSPFPLKRVDENAGKDKLPNPENNNVMGNAQ